MQLNFAGPLQIRRAIYSARRELLLAMPGDTCALDEQVDLSASQTVTGVSVRMYVPAAARGGSGFPEHQLTALAKNGVEIRTTRGNVPRMVIVDQSVVVLARNRVDYSDGALVGRDLPFTAMLVRSLTTSAPAEESGASTDDRVLDPLSREVLRQLTLGTKDEVAARELGMALRTYRRVVARLMGTLDARSRFQAGYRAAQSNWL